MGRIAVGVDRAFLRFAFRSRRASRRGTRETSAARIDEAAIFYDRADRESRLFVPPAPAALIETRSRALPGGAKVDVRFDSPYSPLRNEYRALLDAHPETRVAWARWLRHPAPAPALVCLHGWGGGNFALMERAFHARRFYGLGADVLLFAVPFHGRRAPLRLGPPLFPSTDPIRTNEGFAQAIADLRSLVLALRARGAPAVAVTGHSLGGFTTALLATLEADLAAAVPMIPFASVPQLMWEHGEGTPARERARSAGVTFERFAAAFKPICVLERRPALRGDRMLVVAGERDQVTPKRYALRIAEHFSNGAGGRARMITFPGGHLLQDGRAQAYRAVSRFLAERGVVSSPMSEPRP